MNKKAMMSGHEVSILINMSYPIIFTWVLYFKKSLFGNVGGASTLLPFLEGESNTYVKIWSMSYREEGE